MPISLVPLAMSLIAVVSPVRPAAPRSDRIDSLRASIDRRIAEVKGAVVGVAFHDLGTADSLFVNADDSFHAASTMKVPRDDRASSGEWMPGDCGSIKEFFSSINSARSSTGRPIPSMPATTRTASPTPWSVRASASAS